MRLPHLHRPGHVDAVGGGGGELGEVGDVDGSRWSLWFSASFVGGDRIGQRTQFVIDFDTD